MAPKEDPVIAEYDVFLTPALVEQIYLLQYLNRPRERPYNERSGARPGNVRIKPKSGFLEMDIDMHAGFNFNKYQSLKWGDALVTAKQLQNDTAHPTYGPASGFSNPRSARPNTKNSLKDKVERDTDIYNNLAHFEEAQQTDKVLKSQTLGGKIMRLENNGEGAQPRYFVGAFRGKQLHLSKVDGTVQMRPQFHHVDAEDQRNRVIVSRAAAADSADANRPAPAARALQQSYKDLNDEKDKDAPERRMRKVLQDAEEELWSDLNYVDEQEDLAYETFRQCMFIQNTESAKLLKSGVDAEQYLDLISKPAHDTHNRRRKRSERKKDTVEIEDDED